MSGTAERAVEHAPQTDIPALDALLDAEAYMYRLGFRDGHAAGLLESDRRVSDSVRHMLADLRNGGLL